MKTAILLTMHLFTILANSQELIYKGINWTKEKSWDAVIQKAKSENKYIFIDAYATWCTPCKRMDKETYPKESVGSFMNEKFISIKVQMDTSINDDEATKAWYKDAHIIQTKYQVNGFPTFLYFSPDGEIVHRFTGAVSDNVLIAISKRALDPDRQFYTLVKRYTQGGKDYDKMKYLVRTSREMGEKELAERITKDYFKNYLQKQPPSVLLAKPEIEFIIANLSHVKIQDNVFQFFYNNVDAVNRIMDSKDISQSMVSFVISREKVNQKIWPNNKPVSEVPKWEKLYETLKKEYNEYFAQRVILGAKLRWYNEKKDWPNILKYNIEKIEKQGIDTTGYGKALLNNMIWDVIFKHSNKREELEKGILWMEKILETAQDDPTYMDTYANLLYKVGRKDEAIQWETKAAEIEDGYAKAYNRKPDPAYRETIVKMKMNIPTWSND